MSLFLSLRYYKLWFKTSRILDSVYIEKQFNLRNGNIEGVGRHTNQNDERNRASIRNIWFSTISIETI